MDFKDGDLLAYEQSLQRQGSLGDRKSGDKLGRNQKSAKIQKRVGADKKCTSCGTTSTPVWRWGGEAKEVLLCNACSLRIRRSATRPQRAKSPTDLSSQKQSPLVVSGDTGSPSSLRPASDMPADAEAFRLELLRCVEFHLGLEKARLLGPREQPLAEEWPPLSMGSYGNRLPLTRGGSAQLGSDYKFPSQQGCGAPDQLHFDGSLAYGSGDLRQLRML